MTQDELNALTDKRKRANELRFSSTDVNERKAAQLLVEQLDAEIHTAQQQLRQTKIELDLYRRMRAGYAGDDESFRRLWDSGLKDEALKTQIAESAAKAENESARMLRNWI